MTGLAAFTAARLDEDEESACEAVQRPWRCEDNHIVDLDGGDVARFNIKADAAHAAMYEPARVLREVAAKRAILEQCMITLNRYRPPVPTGKSAEWALASLVMDRMASAWSDHPDYGRGRAP